MTVLESLRRNRKDLHGRGEEASKRRISEAYGLKFLYSI
jgi:hypothetical protein